MHMTFARASTLIFLVLLAAWMHASQARESGSGEAAALADRQTIVE